MDELNQRQTEVIEHFITPKNYEKPISTKIIHGDDKDPKNHSCQRHKKFLKLGCIENIKEREGRNTAYRLVVPKEDNMSLKQRYDTR